MAYTDIDKSDEYFNTVTYSGNGSTQSITGVGFQPDLIWGKGRTLAGYNHGVVDIVRGTGKNIYTNLTQAEETYSTGITSFNSDGFSVGSGNVFNNGSNTYVAWNWLASNTTASNTDGDITSTVSANTTSGFSIVSYTGNGSTNQTIGHGLGVEPDFIIVKATSTTMNWPTYSKALGNGVAFLDVTDAWANTPGAYDNYWYTSGMTSSTFGVSNNVNTNTNGATFIAYVFAQKKGFSKFGSYIGNGSTNGSYIHLGFKPAFVLIKSSSLSQDWFIHDNKRSTFNVSNTVLLPNTADLDITDLTVYGIDMVSNGFKVRGTHARINQSGSSYIYMAFAESPFTTSTGIPTTAR